MREKGGNLSINQWIEAPYEVSAIQRLGESKARFFCEARQPEGKTELIRPRGSGHVGTISLHRLYSPFRHPLTLPPPPLRRPFRRHPILPVATEILTPQRLTNLPNRFTVEMNLRNISGAESLSLSSSHWLALLYITCATLHIPPYES